MSQPARFAGAARRELAKALCEIEHDAAAQRLRDAIATAARRIGARPLLGRQALALADARYRFWSVAGFPYLIVYRPDLSPPSIVRFVHTARGVEKRWSDCLEP